SDCSAVIVPSRISTSHERRTSTSLLSRSKREQDKHSSSQGSIATLKQDYRQKDVSPVPDEARIEMSGHILSAGERGGGGAAGSSSRQLDLKPQ
ncbi:Packaging protein UL32, partial [Dissostichus eleginoides]